MMEIGEVGPEGPPDTADCLSHAEAMLINQRAREAMSD